MGAFQINPSSYQVESDVSFSEFLSLCWLEKWKIIFSTFSFMIIGVFYAFTVESVYQIDADLNIAIDESAILTKVESNDSPVLLVYLPHLKLAEELEIISSQNLLDKVIAGLDLDEKIGDNSKRSPQLLEKRLLSKINASAKNKSKYILTISMQSSNVGRDQQILQKLLQVYQQNQIARTVKKSQSILNSLDQTGIIPMDQLRTMAASNVEVLKPATIVQTPIKPKKKMIVLIAAILGMCTSIFVVYIISWLQNKIYGPEKIEQLGLNVLCTIPAGASFELRSNPKFIDSMCLLRTVISNHLKNSHNNIIMFTAPNYKVGDGVIGQCLALLETKIDKKVLFIDADMRNKKVQLECFGCDNNKKMDLCLASLLKKNELNITHELTGKYNLNVILSGSDNLNASELLSKQIFCTLLEWANKNYDVVIINAPPVLEFSDACVIGKYVSVNILTVKQDYTTYEELQQSVKRFNQAGIDVTGVVFYETL